MIKHLEIKSPKIKKERKILLISDIHIDKKDKSNNLKKLKEEIKKEFKSIDYILITGDIIDSPKYLIDENYRNNLAKILKEFTSNKETYIELGNHDICTNNLEEEYIFSILNEISNIKCLNNKEIINLKDISIKGFSPNIDYYKKHHGSKNEFLRQFIEVKTDKINKKTYNILLTHDPSSIIKLSKENNKLIEDIDLVISGHMHNGLVPNKIQKIMKNRGFVGPYKTLYPRYAHGIIKIKETSFIILGAINSIIKLPILNKIYGYNATILTLNKK